MEQKNTLFCKYCKNLLSTTYTPNFYQIECKKCSKSFDINEYDTLIYEESNQKFLQVYYKKSNIVDDPLNIREFSLCKNCGKKRYIKSVRLESDLSKIKVCETCREFTM